MVATSAAAAEMQPRPGGTDIDGGRTVASQRYRYLGVHHRHSLEYQVASFASSSVKRVLTRIGRVRDVAQHYFVVSH